MKKICFVTMGNIYIAPYINSYTKYLNCPYSIIYWDRENREESDGINTYYRYSKNIISKEIIKKVIGYFQFRKFAKKVLWEHDFDIIVLLQTWSAILLSDILIRHYARKYIIDIRDYTYEKNPVIYNIEKNIIAKSRYCVVSSAGYKEFLPSHDYFVVHNLHKLPSEKVLSIRNRLKEREQLHIAFIGYVNYQKQHKKLMLNLKDDLRFRLSFIGTRAKELKSFCIQNRIRNVKLIDTFDSSEAIGFYEDVDLVNNLYGNHTPALDYALSNKLYFATELRIPILVCQDTYMSKVAEEYGVGLTVNVDDKNLGDRLYDYYRRIDWKKFNCGCEKFLEKVYSEQRIFEEMLKRTFE